MGTINNFPISEQKIYNIYNIAIQWSPPNALGEVHRIVENGTSQKSGILNLILLMSHS